MCVSVCACVRACLRCVFASGVRVSQVCVGSSHLRVGRGTPGVLDSSGRKMPAAPSLVVSTSNASEMIVTLTSGMRACVKNERQCLKLNFFFAQTSLHVMLQFWTVFNGQKKSDGEDKL